MKPILTKADFYKRFHRGEFGNHSPMWNTIEEWRADGYRGEVAIRTKVPGGRCDYFISPQEVPSRWREFLLSYSPDLLHISAQCPEKHSILQGEVMISGQWVARLASNPGTAMREAMAKHSSWHYGLDAQMRIRRAMCDSSWSWLQHLLHAYEDHVVEFTTLGFNWGAIPGYNTLFWEVRKY